LYNSDINIQRETTGARVSVVNFGQHSVNCPYVGHMVAHCYNQTLISICLILLNICNYGVC